MPWVYVRPLEIVIDGVRWHLLFQPEAMALHYARGLRLHSHCSCDLSGTITLTVSGDGKVRWVCDEYRAFTDAELQAIEAASGN